MNHDFLNSSFWTQLFPFLTLIFSLCAIIYQTKKIIPNEADKLLLNKVFDAHHRIFDTISKARIICGTASNEEEHHYLIMHNYENWSNWHESFSNIFNENKIYLSKSVYFDCLLINNLYRLLYDYINGDSNTLLHLGKIYKEELMKIFEQVDKDIVIYFTKGKSKSYVFPIITDSEIILMQNKLNQLLLIKETIGDCDFSRL